MRSWPQSDLAAEYRVGLEAMYALHDGETIEAAARSILAKLPRGPLALVTTSVEGAALAAVCCVLAGHADLRWEYVSLGRPVDSLPDVPVVAIEPIHPGAWRREALASPLPRA